MLFAILMLIGAAQAHAQESCSAAFAYEPNALLDHVTSLQEIRLVPEELPTDKKSPEFRAKLIDLLDMYNSAVYQENKKDPFKKRELYFARQISENQSVEFEYLADARGDKPVYRLARVSYYKPNGQDLVLDKAPVSDDGRSLKQSSFALAVSKGEIKPVAIEELSEKANAGQSLKGESAVEALRSVPLDSHDHAIVAGAVVHDVRMPLVIDGPIFDELSGWLNRFQYLKSPEIDAAVKSGSMNRLVWFSSSRAGVRFFGKFLRNRVFKYMFLIGIVAGISHLPGTSALMPYMPMHSKLEHLIHPRDNNIENNERDIVKNVLNATKKKSDEISASFLAAKETIKKTVGNDDSDGDFKRMSATIASLSDSERKAGGTPVLFTEGLRQVAVSSNNQAFVKQVGDSYDKSYIIAEFKKQNTILLIPMVQVPRASSTDVTVLEYTQAANPDTFGALDSLLATKLASAKKKNKVDASTDLAGQ